MYQFCYILIVGTSRDYFLGLVSNIEQKGLRALQATACRQAPQDVYTTWRKCGSCPLEELTVWGPTAPALRVE